MSLLAREDIRFVPVIACAFADEELKFMFQLFLPGDIPGGKKSMLSRFGPISGLFARIQFAFAFDMVHSDVLMALDNRETLPNRFPWKSVNSSKQLDFGNRTKRARSRGSERNSAFRRKSGPSCRTAVRSPP
jgi:hypothetical protein